MKATKEPFPLLIRLSLCCNHPDTGMALGYVDALQVAGLSLSGRPIKIGDETKKLHFGRLRMPIYGFINWHGNWCWDSVKVTVSDAVRVLEYTQKAGWECDEGTIELYEAYNAGLPITAEMIVEFA